MSSEFVLKKDMYKVMAEIGGTHLNPGDIKNISKVVLIFYLSHIA